MSNHELNQEEYIQKRFLQQTNRNSQVANNLNEQSNQIYGPRQINQNNVQPFVMGTPCEPDLLKDQNFVIQKEELVKILTWLLIGSVIELFAVFFCITQFESLKVIAPLIFCASFVFLIALCLMIKLRPTKDFSLLIYFGVNTLLGITAGSFCGLLNDFRPPNANGSYLTNADVAIGGVIFQILVNGVVQLSVLFQLLIEKREIPTLLLITVVSMCSMCAISLFVVPGMIALLYDLLLLIALNRTLKGEVENIQYFKLKLRTNSVFANVNSINAAILIPCLN